MQFNYLGGQSQRDTLSQALGQRNPVLESQLAFNREAFTTGLQGANATLRTSMQIGAQESESAMRNKTAKQEGAMNRQSSKDLLSERLTGEKTEFDRRFDISGKQSAEERQRRLDDQADVEKRALQVQSDKETRAAKLLEDANTLEIDNLRKKQEGALEGMKLQFDALIPNMAPELRDGVKKQWDAIHKKLIGETDPIKRSGMMATLGELLNPKTSVAIYRDINENKEKQTTEQKSAQSRFKVNAGAWGGIDPPPPITLKQAPPLMALPLAR